MSPDLYNSYITRTYDITGRDNASLSISFDYDFVSYDTQLGTVEISFDGGTTWIPVLTLDSDGLPNSTVFSTANGEQGTFVAGTDFNLTAGDLTSNEMLLRFGCLLAGNDWWFAVDNISVDDMNGNIAFEDFEDQSILDTMVPFSAANGGPTEPSDPSDGTDWTRDIPDWTVINDGTSDYPTKQLYLLSQEEAWNGWAALDVNSWFDQQGDQQRGFFDFPVGSRNTALIADGDAHDDRKVADQDAPPEGEFQYNSFVQRTYDMSGYDNTTLNISFDWDTRLEDSQRFICDVSFDYGLTWTNILDVDSSRLDLVDGLPEEPDYEMTLAPFLFNDNNSDGFVNNGDLLNTFAGPQLFDFTDAFGVLPAKKSNTLTLRFGCINTGNDWWAAVDNVLVEAETQEFVMGDANGDGMVTFADIDAFAAALFGDFDPRFDFCADGVINFADIDGFTAELFN